MDNTIGLSLLCLGMITAVRYTNSTFVFIAKSFFDKPTHCSVVTQVNTATFTLNNITIDDFDEKLVSLGFDEPGLDIKTDATGFTPYTTHNLLVGESVTFNLFDIWSDDIQVTRGEDNIDSPITVTSDFSGATGDPINGIKRGFPESGTVLTILGSFKSDINDEGQVVWGPPVEFSFSNGGRFSIILSDTPFNQELQNPFDGGIAIDGQCANLYGCQTVEGGQPFGATIEATLLYVKAPTVVPVPPAILMIFLD